MDIISRLSPNFDSRPSGTDIDSVVIHYTAKSCVEDAIAVFEDPNSKLSSHYTICRQGQLFQHVDTSKRAWHAGRSEFGCRKTFNDFSIGIELYNPGHRRGYLPYTIHQIEALTKLMYKLYSEHPIRPELVLGHSDISPDRKQDPGELFPWCILVSKGLAKRPSL
jgi:N-acetylmuramoyl-L-alanine amidase